LKIVAPVTSVGKRSGVNWMRRQSLPIERAMVLASSVFPTPGTSSIRRCPSASKHVSAKRICGPFPWMTRSMFSAIRLKTAGKSPFEPVLRWATIVLSRRVQSGYPGDRASATAVRTVQIVLRKAAR